MRLGDRSFASAGPRVWNSLPTQLRESRTLHSDNFDEHSKRIYLVTDSCSAEWQCFHALCINLLTSLFTWSNTQLTGDTQSLQRHTYTEQVFRNSAGNPIPGFQKKPTLSSEIAENALARGPAMDPTVSHFWSKSEAKNGKRYRPSVSNVDSVTS